jgi:para-aminobenzoate synthetase
MRNDPSELSDTGPIQTEQIGDIDVHTMIPAEEAGPTDTAVAEYSGGVER